MPPVLTRVTTDGTGRRVLSIRTSPGFDPAEFAAYAIFQYRNFVFEYTRESTIKDRVWVGDHLRYQVDTTLASRGWYYTTEGQREVRNSLGEVIATGMFVERNDDTIYGDEDLRRPDEVKPLDFLQQHVRARSPMEEDEDDSENQRSPSSGENAEDLNDNDFDATEDAIDGE